MGIYCYFIISQYGGFWIIYYITLEVFLIVFFLSFFLYAVYVILNAKTQYTYQGDSYKSIKITLICTSRENLSDVTVSPLQKR